MKIINLVKSEFKKNFSIKKLLISILVLLLSSLAILKLNEKDIVDESLISYDTYLANYNQILEWENDKKRQDLNSKYSFVTNKTRIELIKELKEKGIPASRWNLTVALDISMIEGDNYLIDRVKNNPGDSEILEICEDDESNVYFSSQLHTFCNSTKEELNAIYLKNIEMINKYKELLQENQYYKYIEYEIEIGKLESNRFTDLLIEKKVETSDSYIGLNYLLYNDTIDNEENLKIIRNEDMSEECKEKIIEDNKASKEILFYSSEKDIKHDLEHNDYNGISDFLDYNNSKKIVNQVYHLSFVIMILISIMYGGIVSQEHSKGTIKNLISTPVRRWKILASKFIYLVLNTYILWIIGLVIISLIAGIKYGFTDLFTPKLLYSGGEILEVNYYLYVIKNILIASIPMICFLSILFFFSAVTLNTALTVGITSGISIISPFLFLLSANNHIKEIVYTPIWYFDCGFIFNNSRFYIASLMKNFYHFETGIIISFIIGIIFYIITTMIYSKRDIKN